MISLPEPYEDELLYSVFARAVAYLAPISEYAARKLLFGMGNHSVLFGSQVDELAKITRPNWGLSSQEIVERHTMLPFYGRVLAPAQVSACLDMIAYGAKGKVRGALGLQHQSNVVSPVYLRFCRSCTLNDLACYGETFWRRSHQLSGALVCAMHGEVLRCSRAAIFSGLKKPQDATTSIDPESAPECELLTPVERRLATRVATRCVELLQGSRTVWGNSGFREKYRQCAIDCGYVGRTGNSHRLSDQQLATEFIEFFGPDLLKKMGCNDNFAPYQCWLKIIFRSKGGERFHPLLHVLVQLFLEEKAATGCRRVTIPSTREAREARKWKCPNPYAPHDDAFRTPVDLRWEKGRRMKTYFSAKCSCGYAFSFRQGCADDPQRPDVSKVCAWGPYFHREAKRLKREGRSIVNIASRMKIGRDVVRQLINGKANKFERSLSEIRSWRKTWLRTRSKSLYRKLLRHDRAWLSAQAKKVCRGGTGRANDWPRLDITYAPLLRLAIERLRTTFPTRRISYRAVERECGIKSLKKKARRMPKCWAILAGAFEHRRYVS